MGKFHCPTDGTFVSNVMAETTGNIVGAGSWVPSPEWFVFGDCSKCQKRIRIEDHDGDDRCECWSVNIFECWWSDEDFQL